MGKFFGKSRRIFLDFKFKIFLHVSATFLHSSLVLTFSAVLILFLRSSFPAFFFYHFFQIFFWRYHQIISFFSFSVVKLSNKLHFSFECTFLFSKSEILYFILQELSLSQNDSSKLPFTNAWIIGYRSILKNRTFTLCTLN